MCFSGKHPSLVLNLLRCPQFHSVSLGDWKAVRFVSELVSARVAHTGRNTDPTSLLCPLPHRPYTPYTHHTQTPHLVVKGNFQKPVSHPASTKFDQAYTFIMVDSIAESARKASAGTWRKPRVRIYDYNQVCSHPFQFQFCHKVTETDQVGKKGAHGGLFILIASTEMAGLADL